MNKAVSFSVMFTAVTAGLSLCFVYAVHPVMFLITLVLCPLMFLFYNRTFSKHCFFKKGPVLRTLVFISSAASAAYTLALSAQLVTKTGVVSNDCFALVLVLSSIVVLSVAYSKKHACRFISVSTAVTAALFLLIILILSLLDTEFSAPSFGNIDKNILLPFAAFSAFDTFLVIPLMSDKTRFGIYGALFPCLYMLCAALAAVSVLSAGVYYSLELPLLRLWQSTYIASFVNRFEMIGICALFALCIVKAGLVFRAAASIISKKRFWLSAVVLVSLAVIMICFDLAVILLSAVVILTGISLPLLFRSGK